MQDKLLKLRKEYARSALLEQDVMSNPLEQLSKWLDEAIKSGVSEPNAMALATVNEFAQPSVRIVLLRDITQSGLVFYTNYQSRKGQDIAANASVSVLFYWPELERQVRLSGVAEKLAAHLSDQYFAKRPRGSQIGAWASPQSQVIPSREALEAAEDKAGAKFAGMNIPRPLHWGGYEVKVQEVEFWQGRENRLHDRLLFTYKQNIWKIERLAP